MTDLTAGRLRQVSRVVTVHPLTVRITHWVNALAIFIMIMSGWRIYNSDPIFQFSFPVWLTLGGSYDGSVDLHNEDGLAGVLQWHFAGMWLLTINGMVYIAYGIVSGHFRRSFFRSVPAHSCATPSPHSSFGCRISSGSIASKRRSSIATGRSGGRLGGRSESRSAPPRGSSRHGQSATASRSGGTLMRLTVVQGDKR